ncbi:MAG TPA: hypothetical protein GXX18_11465 [Bacillales bacterium]|nr:hypothetical protein [Bacillales bacterium]
MKGLLINGTQIEIDTLEQVVQNSQGKIAILFESLRRANEILHSLTVEEQALLNKYFESHPILETIILSEEEPKQRNLPSFLTVNDVSELLSISPQAVRRHCTDNKISAWRTLGDSGEWRIDFKQFKDHPNINAILVRYQNRNRQISEMATNNSELIHQFKQAKERRDEPSYYNNDIGRFNELVDNDE